jgi:hypothetical protein
MALTRGRVPVGFFAMSGLGRLPGPARGWNQSGFGLWHGAAATGPQPTRGCSARRQRDRPACRVLPPTRGSSFNDPRGAGRCGDTSFRRHTSRVPDGNAAVQRGRRLHRRLVPRPSGDYEALPGTTAVVRPLLLFRTLGTARGSGRPRPGASARSPTGGTAFHPALIARPGVRLPAARGQISDLLGTVMCTPFGVTVAPCPRPRSTR